ncbi:hypothetical protein CDL12_14455 [Handroanthus impetiginosus]|uniref:SHSP domain-containing protein n=1 Tax=Handroanthus impetiginosus TaxID=429701 RepID=A0A2G9H6J6_9LAMI|nr:hypothetical protein CDL12_14455 [Handroanthus impetiginosus]
MDASNGNPTTENTTTFVPSSNLISEKECDTLVIHLPGFTKEHLRVQLSRSGVLKISGSRPIGENKWNSFQKDFPVSQNYGILYVRQPKLIVPEEKAETIPPQESTPEPQKPEASEKSEQEQEKATPTDDKNKQKSVYEKPEAKVEEKSRETEAAKKDERKPEKVSRTYKRDSVASGVAGDYKPKAEKLKMARKMTMVLAVVFAFALGMYVSKYMAWFERKAES